MWKFHTTLTVTWLSMVIGIVRISINNQFSSFTLQLMQFGFRANYCFYYKDNQSLLDKGDVVGTVFLDVNKAFDTVKLILYLSRNT